MVGLFIGSITAISLLIVILGLVQSVWLTIPIWILLTAAADFTLVASVFGVWTASILMALLRRGYSALAAESGMSVLGLGERSAFVVGRFDGSTKKPSVNVYPYSELGSPKIFRDGSDIVLVMLSNDGREYGRLYFADMARAQLDNAFALLARSISFGNWTIHDQ